MLKHLHIQNIILIEEATLSFKRGLNVLTGETGSGKSAIMHSIGLVTGERADTTCIRRGCEKGSVEALFEIENGDLYSLLNEGGIGCEKDQPLIIRREISLSGKGKIFINHQLAQLSFLRKVGQLLVQILEQHANQSLFSLDYHRQVLDQYGNLEKLLFHFRQSFEQEKKIRFQLEEFIQHESQRVREIEVCKRELAELKEANIKEGEEEELFAEYTRLSHSEEISTKIGEIHRNLSSERAPLLTILNKQKQILETLTSLDSFLKEVAAGLKNICLELQELLHSLRLYQSRLHSDPGRLHQINERLTLLDRLKRKYGATIKDVLEYQAHSQAKLKKLENGEVEIDHLQKELQKVEETTVKLAKELSSERRHFAKSLGEALSQQLQSLNMSRAVFEIDITEQNRTREGDDSVEFFLYPNVGESKIRLIEGASGGEISRILLALQTVLKGKERFLTLIFDEVDANIGGETATIVGHKLNEIGQQHQVICITHFPQIALQADHHLGIAKEERSGRTVTLVNELNAAEKAVELARMGGYTIGADVTGTVGTGGTVLSGRR